MGSLLCAAMFLIQVPESPMRLAVGFGVDTARSPNREIFALYRSYLGHRLDSVRPNPYWSRAEQTRWPLFDLLSGAIYQGLSNFTLVHLAPAVGLDSTYLIRTLISSVHDPGNEVKPLALYRVFATREGGRWVLANALPRLTRTWRSTGARLRPSTGRGERRLRRLTRPRIRALTSSRDRLLLR